MISRNTYLIVLFTLILPFTLKAQKKATIMMEPAVYVDMPTGEVLSKSTGKGIQGKGDWVVCSDRDNNKTFVSANSVMEFKTMSFMDKFYVTDENGEFLHLYKYNTLHRESGSSRRLTAEAEDWGWAPKSKLLLWKRAIVNNKKLSLKALPILKENNFMVSESFIKKEGTLKLFSNPALTTENGNAIKMFQFLFIYKKEGNSILIAKGLEAGPMNIEHKVLGWVSTDIVQLWNDRVCLEPSSDEDDVSARRSGGIKASLFVNKEEALKWKSTGSGDPVWDDDYYEKRPLGTWKRFPILEFEKGYDVVKTGYVTDVLDEKNKSVASVEDHARAEQALTHKINEARKVNFVFVVDAGSGMNAYMENVKSVIERAIDRNRGSDQSIRYGAVVFRDEQDISCPAGDLSVIKTNGLTRNSDLLTEFLTKQIALQGCKKSTRALNKAIVSGLRMFEGDGANKDQTNVLVVIGGGLGKEIPRATKGDISKLIAQTRAHFLVYQVVQGGSDDFNNFPTYFGGILRDASKAASAITRADDKGGSFKSSYTEPKFSPKGENAYVLDYPYTSNMNGLISFVKRGQSMSADAMSESLDSMTNFIQSDIERIVNVLTTSFEGIGRKDIKIDASVLKYLVSIGKEVNDQELIKKYAGKNFQFFVPGYTSISTSKVPNPVFKRMLFVHTDEMSTLKESMRKLVFEGTGSEVRDRLYNAYSALLATYLGEKNIKEAVTKMTAQEVLSLAFDIPSNNKTLAKYTIADFKRQDKVSDAEIRSLQAYFVSKLEKLQGIEADPRYLYSLPWGVFYWVPEDYLP